MEAYAKEQGYGSFEHFLDSVEAVKEMVFYHLIDGEANEVGNYETAGFTSGAIDTKNMLGRYLYTSIVPDGTSWMINNSARIVSGDHIKVNGVVHIVDKALAGNTDLLADYIETEGHFKLYGEALHATGLRKFPYASGRRDVRACYDQTVGRPVRFRRGVPQDQELPLYGFAGDGFGVGIKRNPYAGRHAGICQTFLSGRERSAGYGRGQQPVTVFVAYHLLPVMLASNQIVNTRDYVVTRHVDRCGLAA